MIVVLLGIILLCFGVLFVMFGIDGLKGKAAKLSSSKVKDPDITGTPSPG